MERATGEVKGIAAGRTGEEQQPGCSLRTLRAQAHSLARDPRFASVEPWIETLDARGLECLIANARAMGAEQGMAGEEKAG